MKAFFILATGFLAVQAVIVGTLIGEGSLIHWLFPAVDIVPAVIAATGAAVIIVLFVCQTAPRLPLLPPSWNVEDDNFVEDSDDDDFDEEEDTEQSAEQARAFQASLPSLPPLRPRHSRRRRKKK